jgi:hypothetical protein
MHWTHLSRAGLAALAICWLAEPATAEPYELSDCPEVIVVLEDPVEPDGTVGPAVAAQACQKLQELAPKFGLALTGAPMVRLMIADDPEAFTKHTGRGGMTQAIYSVRTGIITQPAKIIRRMHKSRQLGGLLAHELTHYLIHQTAGQRCPTWLHEGLAQWFEGRGAAPGGPASELELARLEMAWRAGGSPAQQAWCYRQSLALVARLLAKVPEQALTMALAELPELEDPLDLPVHSRPLRVWLFGDQIRNDPDDQPHATQVEILRGPDQAAGATEDGLTPLPLEEMLKQAQPAKKHPAKRSSQRKLAPDHRQR